jgi:uncharacterized lipoprotein YajG
MVKAIYLLSEENIWTKRILVPLADLMLVKAIYLLSEENIWTKRILVPLADLMLVTGCISELERTAVI